MSWLASIANGSSRSAAPTARSWPHLSTMVDPHDLWGVDINDKALAEVHHRAPGARAPLLLMLDAAEHLPHETLQVLGPGGRRTPRGQAGDEQPAIPQQDGGAAPLASVAQGRGLHLQPADFVVDLVRR